MNSHGLILGAIALLSLGACDKAKPRDLPPDPFAAAPAPLAPSSAAGGPMSVGLAKRPEIPAFTLDHAGAAPDPLNRQPAVTAAGAAAVFDGFGFDGEAMAPAKGVDVVIDAKAYSARYGSNRKDVAEHFNKPALGAVGFTVTLPAGALTPGPHTAFVRVIAADGKAYFESPPIGFTAK